MGAKTKKALKPADIVMPKNLEEAATYVWEIGLRLRTIDAIEVELNAKIEAFKSQAIEKVQPFREGVERLVRGVFLFAEKERDTITEGGKHKTINFPTGSIGWRLNPPAVSIRNEEKILQEFRDRGLADLIRTKEEIDRQAILKNPESVAGIRGITIGQHEEFVIKPSQIKVEITSTKGKLKVIKTEES